MSSLRGLKTAAFCFLLAACTLSVHGHPAIHETFQPAEAGKLRWHVSGPGIVYSDVCDTSTCLHARAEAADDRVELRGEISTKELACQTNDLIAVSLRARVGRRSGRASASIALQADPSGWTPARWIPRPTPIEDFDQWQTVTSTIPCQEANIIALVIEINGAELWLSDIKFSAASIPPEELISELQDSHLDRLRILARFLSALRFKYPGDRSADADWHVITSQLVRATLRDSGLQDFEHAMSQTLRDIAPEARLRPRDAHAEPLVISHAGPGFWTQWRHAGGPANSFREGINEPDDASVAVSATVDMDNIPHCHSAVVLPDIATSAGADSPTVFVVPQRGQESPPRELLQPSESAKKRTTIPDGSSALTFGIFWSGFGQLTIRDLVLYCDDARVASLLDQGPPRLEGLWRSMYRLDVVKDGSRSPLVISRHYNNASEQKQRAIPIADNLSLMLPLTLWTPFDKRTPKHRSTAQVRSSDLLRSERLATMLDAWIVLDQFYPYFADLHIDWSAAFAPALRRAAASASSQEFIFALQWLLAQLYDGHGLLPEALASGTLPVQVRRVDGQFTAIKVLDEYSDLIPPGSTILEIDHERVTDAEARVSAFATGATPGWKDLHILGYLASGATGGLGHLRVLRPDGASRDVVVPRIAKDEFQNRIRKTRRRNGEEVAPGIYYVNLSRLDAATWESVRPQLVNAVGVIFDVRGYITKAAWDVAASLTDRVMESPRWERRMTIGGEVDAGATTWTIRPIAPRIRARAAFLADAQTISAAETLLQFVRAYHLGAIVGQRTAGANGDVAVYTAFNGVELRFSSIRDVGRDGLVIQGKGVVPDLESTPTREGVRTGKDEVLEAAIHHLQSKQ